jgi:hypothetical protein
MLQTVGVGTFGYVVIVIGCLGIVAAFFTLSGTGALYDRIGKGAFSLDEPDRPRGPAPGSAQARREARGERPLDVEAEIAALTKSAPIAADDELREEVRQLVQARNERRVARGQEPLDVEAEVDRQLRDLG